MSQIIETKEIPLDQLVIGTSQVRTREVGKDIDELAESIKKLGLIQPILVAPAKEAGKYEIITGQRRFLAHKALGRTSIMASILGDKVNDTEAKIRSIAENLCRRDPNPKDYIDACTALFHKYGSVKAVAEELGLKPIRVSEYIKFDQLVPPLKEMVQKGEVDLKTALRAQLAASSSKDEKVDEGAAKRYALEMVGMSGAQQKRVIQSVQETPGRPVEQVIETARAGESFVKLNVRLIAPVAEALDRYSADQKEEADKSAADLIEEGLSGKGFLQSDE
jgi:ParB family chromosome partitioning protein